MNDEFKTIRDIGKEYRISRIMLQRYERIGLIHYSGRNKYGHLLYDGQAVNRIVFIRYLQNCGFELPEIKALFEMSRSDLKKALIHKVGVLRDEHRRISTLIEKTNEVIGKLDDSGESAIIEIILREEKK